MHYKTIAPVAMTPVCHHEGHPLHCFPPKVHAKLFMLLTHH